MDCPFCNPAPERVFHGSDPGFICLWDGFAVSPGHALVVPRRHVATWFDATFDEQVTLLRGIEIAKKAIESHHRPDGFNIGVNVGAAGGGAYAMPKAAGAARAAQAAQAAQAAKDPTRHCQKAEGSGNSRVDHHPCALRAEAGMNGSSLRARQRKTRDRQPCKIAEKKSGRQKK